jgi:maleylacetate reductase
MIGPFVHQWHRGRVVFGRGRRAELGSEAERLGIEHVMVVSTSVNGRMAEAQEALGSRCVGSFPSAVMHAPVAVTNEALRRLNDLKADGIVAVGGGSALGLAKALALRTDAPIIALPSTYSGSEMTDAVGETDGRIKTIQRAPQLLPRTVVYDVELTLGLPPAIAAVSGLNAVAHAVEALYAPDANPLVSLIAGEGLKAFANALPVVVDTPADLAAGEQALYGAWLCGLCLASVTMSLHHKLCHVLGGMFDLPHAHTHAIILPHAAAYNFVAAPDAARAAASALGGEASQALWELARRVRAPSSLKDIGMPEAGVKAAVEAAIANPYANPRPLERQALEGLLTRAYLGEPPLS